jgi:hypothetical protein
MIRTTKTYVCDFCRATTQISVDYKDDTRVPHPTWYFLSEYASASVTPSVFTVCPACYRRLKHEKPTAVPPTSSTVRT